MNRTICRRAALVICFGWLAAGASAQEPAVQNPPAPAPGAQDQPDTTERAPRREPPFSIKNVSFAAIYSSQNLPAGITSFRDPFPLGSAGSFSASGLVQWLKAGRQSYANVLYAPGYRMRFQNGTSKSSNHSLSLLFNRRSRHSKWQFTASGEADIMSFDEALLSPSKYTRLVSSGAPLDALSDAVLQGNTTDAALANTTGFAPDTKLERFLFGNRTQFVGGEISMHASPSRRLRVNVTAGTSQIKHLQDTQDVVGVVYPSVTAVSFSTDTTYSLTPHSTLGGSASIGQSESTILQNTSAAGTMFYKERLHRHWFFEVSGGTGRNSAASAGRTTYIYSAGTGFESSGHTAMASVARSITDAYVISLGPTSAAFTTVSVTWQWHPKLARWSFMNDFMYFKDQPPHQPAPHSWDLTETVHRRIARAYAVQVEAAVGQLGSRRYIQDGRLYHLRQNALRASFIWYPSRSGNAR